MIKHFLSSQFLKFLFVGATAALANWLARIIFNFSFGFVESVVAAYFVGMLVAFCLNKIYVFPNSTQPLRKQIRDFVLTNFVAFWVVLGTSVVLKSFLEKMGFTFHVAEISHLAALAIPTVCSFLIYKFFAFK